MILQFLQSLYSLSPIRTLIQSCIRLLIRISVLISSDYMMQTSLRIVKCSFCGSYVLLSLMEDHLDSGCREHILGKSSVRDVSIQEISSRIQENKPISLSPFLRKESINLTAYDKKGI